MARARKAKSTSVKVNFKDIETRTRVNKEGDYPLKVIEAVNDKSGSGGDMIAFTLEVTKGEFKGAKAWFYCPLAENSLWKLHAFLTALGVEVPEDEFDIDLSELVDLEVVGVFTPDTYNGKRTFKMTDFTSIEDYAGDEDEDDDKKAKGKKGGKKGKKEEPADEAPDYDDMDEDELRDLVIERELADKKKAKKLDEDELRELLTEADEEAAKAAKKGGKKGKKASDEDEDDDEPKGKKGKKADKGKKPKKKYDKDEVEEMDEDELQELIDESGIDVDLDDYKKLPKKVAAVVEALEDADLLDD